MKLESDSPISCLITGITGTLGRAVSAKLLNDLGDKIHILGVSRDEQKQRFLPKDSRLTLRLGNVSDFRSLADACDLSHGQQFDFVFHFAALKCVDTIEFNPMEALRTNVNGTANVARLAKETFAKMILASTDKAVFPVNSYGCTKGLAERITRKAHHNNVVARYGNVLGSRGSIVESLRKSLVLSARAELTHTEMTRFWMTVEQARDFVLEAAFRDREGLIIPTWIRAASTHDLIKTTAEVLGVKIYDIEITGIRPGEKLHECMATEYETDGKPIYSNDPGRMMQKSELKDLISKALER